MPEELGKIEKPPVEAFKGGRKLFFVPLILPGKNLPQEFIDKYNLYWEEVGTQLSNLEIKLGPVNHIYHELIPDSGEEGLKTLQQLNIGSFQIVQKHIQNGAILEATEDNEILTELMDWSRCLSIGLQSQKVFSTVYQSYTDASNKRNEIVAQKINGSLKDNESGIVFLGEGHHVQFSSDIQVFYIAPPALDGLKRWMRDFESKAKDQTSEDTLDTQDKE